MQKILLLSFTLLISVLCEAQSQTTFILVRHAEKANDGTRNPPLNDAGTDRANRLAALLADQEVTALYATPFKRTQETLAPLAEKTNVELMSYDPYAGSEWLTQLQEMHTGGTVVIAGHSNTIPSLANLLLGEEVLSQFDESDYSNLILVVSNEVGKGKLIRLKF